MIRIFNQYVSPKILVLFLFDSILIAFSLLLGARLRFWNDPEQFAYYTVLPDIAFQALLVVAVFQVCFYYNDLYHLNTIRRRVEQLIRLGQSAGAACILLGFLYFLVPPLLIGRGIFLITTILVLALISVTRLAVDRAWRVTTGHKVLILGTGRLALDLAREFTRREDLHLTLVGLMSPEPNGFGNGSSLAGHSVVGSVTQLEPVVAQHKVSRIVVAMENQRGTLPIRDLVRLRVGGIQVEDAQSTLAALTGRVWLETVRPGWFVFSGGFHRSRLTAAAKRAIDLFFAALGLIFSAPLMGLIAIAIRSDSKGSVFYRQVRVGLRGRHFELFKFRSMQEDAETSGGAQWAAPDDPRVTRVGRFLRKYRLDELPQFLNVLRGDMSFVGPRPERPVFVQTLREQIPYYDERHSVRPGVTGWAQTQYRYGASVEDSFRKLEYDLFYLKNMSVLFDCAIILKTVRIVVFGWGAR